VRERVAPVQPTVTYRVGMRVPQTTQLYAVPEAIGVEVPAIRSYKYMMVNDRVVRWIRRPAKSSVNWPPNRDGSRLSGPVRCCAGPLCYLRDGQVFTLPGRGRHAAVPDAGFLAI
jgi:hypothetical protein